MNVYAVQSKKADGSYTYRHFASAKPLANSTFVGKFRQLTDNETGERSWRYCPTSAWPQPSYDTVLALRPRN